MAISLVTGGALGGSTNNGGNVTITLPTMAQGDVVIAFGGFNFRSTFTPGASSAGYTQLALVNTSGAALWVGYKVMGASPDATFVGVGTGNNADATAYGVYVLRGVSGAVVEATTTTAGPTTSTNPDCPSITTVNENAWVLALALSIVNDASVTIPSGYSNAVASNTTDTNPTTVGGGTLTKASPGAEDPPSFTNWSSGSWTAASVAIKPAALVAAISQALTLAESSTNTTAFVSAISEALTLAESSTNTTAFVSAISEALTLAETTTGGLLYSVSQDEALTLAESSDSVQTFAVVAAEALTLAESSTNTTAFVSAISEALTLAESSSPTASFSSAITETVILDETNTTTISFVVDALETLALVETTADSASFVSQTTETITVADSSDAGITFGVAQQDDATLGEESNAEIATVIVIEAIELAEMADRVLNSTAEQEEAVALSEETNAEVVQRIEESITLEESSGAVLSAVAEEIEGLSLGETLFGSVSYPPNIPNPKFNVSWRDAAKKGNPYLGDEKYIQTQTQPRGITFSAPNLGVRQLLFTRRSDVPITQSSRVVEPVKTALSWARIRQVFKR